MFFGNVFFATEAGPEHGESDAANCSVEVKESVVRFYVARVEELVLHVNHEQATDSSEREENAKERRRTVPIDLLEDIWRQGEVATFAKQDQTDPNAVQDDILAHKDHSQI